MASMDIDLERPAPTEEDEAVEMELALKDPVVVLRSAEEELVAEKEVAPEEKQDEKVDVQAFDGKEVEAEKSTEFEEVLDKDAVAAGDPDAVKTEESDSKVIATEDDDPKDGDEKVNGDVAKTEDDTKRVVKLKEIKKKDKDQEEKRREERTGDERRRSDKDDGDGRRSDRRDRERERDRYDEKETKRRGDADDGPSRQNSEDRDGKDRGREDRGRDTNRSPSRRDYRDRSRSPAYRERRSYSPRRDDRDRGERFDRYERRRSPARDRFRSPTSRDYGSRSRRWSPPRNRHNGIGRPGNNLFIAGFNFITTEKDLERKFSRYGRVLDVRIVRDARSGESRGFGFLTMEHDEDADDAIRSLDKTEWHGRTVLVEKAKTDRRP